MTSRRGFLIGIGAALGAPAIVRAESLMKIAAVRRSLNAQTLIETLVEIGGNRVITFPWREAHLGMAISLIRIDSDGLKHAAIPLEDFYAKAP